MATLQYVDIDNEIKDLANIDSPFFIGEGTTVNPIDTNDTQIVNFRYIKKILDSSMLNFNVDTLESNTNCISGLVPGSDYLVNLYGVNTLTADFPYESVYTSTYPNNYVYVNSTHRIFVNNGQEPLPKGYVKMGYFAILNKANQIIGRNDGKIKRIDWPNTNASFPDSATIRITAPIDGVIYGFMNYGMSFAVPIPVKYMSAIRMNDIKIETYRASIMQQANQTIIVTANGADYKESFTVLPGTEFTTRSEGYPGYKGGTVSPANGVFNEDIIFTVSAATPTTYTATIIQKPHQTITVTYNGNNYTSTITNLPLNASLIIRITNVDYGYSAGRIEKSNIKIKEDITIESTDAKPIPQDITIIQKENETIHVAYKNRIYTENFQADFNSIISITITSNKEETYIPGDIIISGSYTPTEIENEYIVTGEISITASSVRPKPEDDDETNNDIDNGGLNNG